MIHFAFVLLVGPSVPSLLFAMPQELSVDKFPVWFWNRLTLRAKTLTNSDRFCFDVFPSQSSCDVISAVNDGDSASDDLAPVATHN